MILVKKWTFRVNAGNATPLARRGAQRAYSNRDTRVPCIRISIFRKQSINMYSEHTKKILELSG